MKVLDCQVVGTELAIKWDDGEETFVPLEKLRRNCPCAGCQGERDVMGNLYRGPEIPLTAASFQLLQVVPVGGYALQMKWADGHNTGLFSYELLRGLGQGN